MRALLSLSLVAAIGGCSNSVDSLVVVDITADAPLAGVSSFAVTATAKATNKTASFRVSPPSGRRDLRRRRRGPDLRHRSAEGHHGAAARARRRRRQHGHGAGERRRRHDRQGGRARRPAADADGERRRQRPRRRQRRRHGTGDRRTDAGDRSHVAVVWQRHGQSVERGRRHHRHEPRRSADERDQLHAVGREPRSVRAQLRLRRGADAESELPCQRDVQADVGRRQARALRRRGDDGRHGRGRFVGDGHAARHRHDQRRCAGQRRLRRGAHRRDAARPSRPTPSRTSARARPGRRRCRRAIRRSSWRRAARRRCSRTRPARSRCSSRPSIADSRLRRCR